ncbi:MAG: sugar ABC transporter substrate-binding protein [Planctomycetaceae bacterium]
MLGAGAVAIVLAGCSGRAPEGPAPRAAGPAAAAVPRVALVMKSLANEFFATMAKGAQTHQAAAAGRYELIVNGMRNETDVAEQVTLVEQMVARGVRAIVIAPADSRALVPALKQAADAGVLVVNIDNRLDAAVLAELGLRAVFVGPDNRAGARLAGDRVAAALTAGDEVAIIGGIPTADNARERAAGLRDAAEAAGLVVVDEQSGQWEMEKANTIAAAMLGEHPGLRGLLCANDSMALGAVAAVTAAGKTGQVLVSGFDNIPAVQPLLADGRLLATVDQHGDQLAVAGIEAALAILAGDQPSEDLTTPVDLVPGATSP